MMPPYSHDSHSPFISLIYLLLLALAGSVVFTALAFVAGFIIHGDQDILNSAGLLTGAGDKGTDFLKLVQIASTIGTFIVPALALARIESKHPAGFLQFKSFGRIFFLLTIAAMIFSQPFLEWTIFLNKQMELPGFLKGLESWMRQQEYQLERLTLKLLETENLADLLINLLMIAILPAIGEELIFRACLQRILIRWTGNVHAGIWVAAIVFSAIHLQFFGFFPRMLLGALFGYLLFWSKSIWVPILAHFVNNATAVISAYFYQRQGKSLESLIGANEEVSPLLAVVSLGATSFILWYFYRKSKELGAEEVHA